MMITAIINLIIWLVIVGILYWVVLYVIETIPIPDPPARFIRIALTVILVLVILNLLLNMIGVSTGFDTPRIAPSP
jgi:hypothetical protein